jgi:Domain of unknown function (DUF2427)
MRGGKLSPLLVIAAAICCVVTHTAAHKHHDAESPEHSDLVASPATSLPATNTLPVSSNIGSVTADPTVAYIPPNNAHGQGHHHDDNDADMDMHMDMEGFGHNHTVVDGGPLPPDEMSYWLWPEHRGLLYTHIALVVIAWGFVLPVGTISAYPKQPTKM